MKETDRSLLQRDKVVAAPHWCTWSWSDSAAGTLEPLARVFPPHVPNLAERSSVISLAVKSAAFLKMAPAQALVKPVTLASFNCLLLGVSLSYVIDAY